MEAGKETRRVLIIDDEPEIVESLSVILESRGISTVSAASGAEALAIFNEDPVPVVICDYSLPDVQGVDLFGQFKTILPEVQMIVITGKGTIDIAVSAMKAGVFDFVTKPANPEHLIHLTLKARELFDALTVNKTLMEEFRRISDFEFVGRHPLIKKILGIVESVAPTDSTVLVEGDSGTGKELFARLIHKRSHRAKGPFIAVDCGAIPEGLIEAELFGHEKGAFTGALTQRLGRFERASKGTLFLDEITNLPLSSQAKLLRALQEKTIERVGGMKQISVDIRLVTATNVNLEKAVEEGAFRNDLFYRLNVIKLSIPPLRERMSDIPELVDFFIKKHREKTKSPASAISKDALKSMLEYSWPGNVRELENVVEHALIMAGSPLIKTHDLPALNTGASASRLDEAEKNLLIKSLRDAKGNKFRAAKMLGIPRSSLYSKLRKYGIQ